MPPWVPSAAAVLHAAARLSSTALSPGAGEVSWKGRRRQRQTHGEGHLIAAPECQVGTGSLSECVGNARTVFPHPKVQMTEGKATSIEMQSAHRLCAGKSPCLGIVRDRRSPLHRDPLHYLRNCTTSSGPSP
jgi:hypothetical protein